MRRVAAKFVPKLLNCDQKQHRMNIANEMLDSVRDDPNFLQRVITGDEAWVYGYDVETKAQSSQWKLPHEPRPKKARQVRSNVKVLLTVFFDCMGVVHHEFLPQGRTVNKEYYLQVMRNLREAIRQKRPDLWKNKNCLLHHDNAPVHTSLLVRGFLAKNNTLMIPQPPYSPDLAPCYFFLFPKLKRPMKGRRYATLDEIKTASKEELKKIFKNDFLKCFEDWKNRWHKCIISHGDYFEGDKIVHVVQAMIIMSNPTSEYKFKAGRISIEDDPRQGRPTFQRTDENVQKITELIKENPRTTLLELEQDTGISKTTIGRIVTEDLRLKKTPAKFIPRFLTNEQKLCRLATCEDMLEMTRTDPEWKDKIITGDETWVYGYDPETKRQSAEWRGQGEPRPKKSRILKSRNKVLLVAFLDNKGIVHHEYLPAGQTVIKEMYLGILRRLREAIRKEWTNGDWILHHDNARPHTAHLVTSFLAKNGTEILPQPPYSPDIAPNDFFLFPKLKAVLKGRHFDTREGIIEKSLLALKSIPKEAYKNCFDNWEKRWR
ncbi:hypothetical protein LAZ67_15002383 [Cordylochernes scorpioides]|uniref:Transposase n=1 Tax=Cordylochernes scorpioides TaxID=51811 RepID=A0ABY6LDQ1_9ARAC|nr:hypothetical protein LAZ67_15002383 [Cordylochernes scorpioides]